MKRTAGRSTVFLLELLLDLLLFAVCAAICVSLLVRANSVSRQSSALTRATFAAQSAAELYQDQQGEATALASLLGGSLREENVILVSYDANWDAVTEGAGVYGMTIVLSQDGVLGRANITVHDHERGEQIYELGASRVEGVGAHG